MGGSPKASVTASGSGNQSAGDDPESKIGCPGFHNIREIATSALTAAVFQLLLHVGWSICVTMFAAADPEPGQAQRHCFEASNGEPRVIGTEFHILAFHHEELSTGEKRYREQGRRGKSIHLVELSLVRRHRVIRPCVSTHHQLHACLLTKRRTGCTMSVRTN